MNTIDLNSVNRLLLRKQHLADDSHSDNICQIVEDIAGLHGTGTREPYLALLARASNFTKAQLDHELYVRKTLGKVRCMRGTLYILTKKMIPIAYAATRVMMEKLSVRFMEFRGISLSDYDGIAQSILAITAGKTMSIAQIKAKLKTEFNLSAVVNLMCDRGLLIRIQSGNSWKARNYSYTPFHQHFPDVDLAAFSESEGTALLVQQYLKSLGPATEDDIAWWIGLSKSKVREALEKSKKQIVPLTIKDVAGDFVILRSDLELIKDSQRTTEPVVNLLPTLDPYLMGYKQRQRYLHSEDYDNIFDRSGNATSTILLHGRIIGVWDYAEEPEPVMKVHLFHKVAARLLEKIQAKAQRLGQFIAERKVNVREVSAMTPLTRRTAGGYMSPLKDS